MGLSSQLLGFFTDKEIGAEAAGVQNDKTPLGQTCSVPAVALRASHAVAYVHVRRFPLCVYPVKQRILRTQNPGAPSP